MGIASKPISAQPQTVVATNDLFTPVGNHIRVTDLSSAVVIMPGDLGVALPADKVKIQADTQDVRITLAPGSTPTANIGFLVRTTDPIISLSITDGIVLRAIETAGGANLQVQFGV
jgi:2-phospho-L-lactate guanylyltransferase (CobY/MobA/RfbA family)